MLPLVATRVCGEVYVLSISFWGSRQQRRESGLVKFWDSRFSCRWPRKRRNSFTTYKDTLHRRRGTVEAGQYYIVFFVVVGVQWNFYMWKIYVGDSCWRVSSRQSFFIVEFLYVCVVGFLVEFQDFLSHWMFEFDKIFMKSAGSFFFIL